MQAFYPSAFEREMGCTQAELRGWLPGASRDARIEWRDSGADIALSRGSVSISWRCGPPRRLALMTLPRLYVRFEARGVDEAAWQRFMRHFDLYTQRGGG